MKKLFLAISIMTILGMPQLKASKIIITSTKNETGLTSPAILSKTANSKGITDGGFFFHITGNLPSKLYGVPKAITRSEYDSTDNNEPRFGFGPGFEVGNIFRLADLDNMAISLKVTWFSAFYSSMKYDDATTYAVAQGNFVRIGPYFTYALSEKMAIDVSYQFGPSFYAEVMHGSFGGYGVSHTIGFAYRFNVLSVGFDYNFGFLRDDNYDFVHDYTPEELDFYKTRSNHLRLLIGIKL